MSVWTLCLLLLSLQLRAAVPEDTVSQNLGVHQLERLVHLLTPAECKRLLEALSQPEDDIFSRLERLSDNRNRLQLTVRTKRAVPSAAGVETRCREALTDWLLTYGARTYYDRLSRALRRIGRADVAIEVGKNINQDKALNLKRYVEDYHKYVESLKAPPTKRSRKTRVIRRRSVRSLDWRRLDLIVTRRRPPPYDKGPATVALPLLLGMLFGFGGTLLAGASLLLITLYFTG